MAISGAKRPFATGLRNPNGLTFNPETGELWTVVNERDELGNNLVPDYLTSVKDGAFYGWPWSYYGAHVDKRVKPENPTMVKKAIPPDYALSSHVAALGLTFENGSAFPAQYKGGAFVGEHGSWDRQKPNGYQVAFVPFTWNVSGFETSAQPAAIVPITPFSKRSSASPVSSHPS